MKKHKSKWTLPDIKKLRHFAEQGKTGQEIACLMGRSSGAIYAQLHTQGIELLTGSRHKRINPNPNPRGVNNKKS